ncbi:hypothetical protein D0B54_06500 [Solimonas sp. K1W22B-7]|uniref:hypothetical protein n=1 Tax=Solimonas sp. K1W22B-7 TaxID=2303331 RepID=UPI000E32D588|nr:hypothetical protein [Solimonas sp. K1W22B-7]AXQ28351.1 hypothetical protein D0B54_06500 [Solimonas sp. K1W22B-7]
MSSPDTPQEKKRLSYLKDRRNVYGERGANSRHAIRRSKDLLERSRRHGQNQMLHGVLGAGDEAQVVSVENAVRSSPLAKMKFHKMRDEALGKVVPEKLAYRERKGMGRKKGP